MSDIKFKVKVDYGFNGVEIIAEYDPYLVDLIKQVPAKERWFGRKDSHWRIRYGKHLDELLAALAEYYEVVFEGRGTSEYREWSRSIFCRDNGRCVVCGAAGKHAHHINSYADNPRQRCMLGNGVLLCSDCHTEFHKKYGYGHNNGDQWIEFLAEKNPAWELGTVVGTVPSHGRPPVRGLRTSEYT